MNKIKKNIVVIGMDFSRVLRYAHELFGEKAYSFRCWKDGAMYETVDEWIRVVEVKDTHEGHLRGMKADILHCDKADMSEEFYRHCILPICRHDKENIHFIGGIN